MKSLWSNLPTAGRVALVIGVAIGAAGLIATARRDLANRDPSAVRGNHEVWDRVTRFPGGATAYLVTGRSRSPRRPRGIEHP